MSQLRRRPLLILYVLVALGVLLSIFLVQIRTYSVHKDSSTRPEKAEASFLSDFPAPNKPGAIKQYVRAVENAYSVLRSQDRLPKAVFDQPWQHGSDVSAFDPRVPLARLPRLGIVTMLSADFVPTFAREISAMNCYAALHGYGYHVELLNPDPTRHLFQGRLFYYLKYLPMYQWVLMVDGDVMPLNYHLGIHNVIDDAYSVVLTDRDNGEVQSSFFVKNSLEGRNFIMEQIEASKGGVPHFNYDQGDLEQILMQRALAVASNDDQAQIKAVLAMRNINYLQYIKDFRTVLDRYHSAMPGIKIHRLGWGHLRSFEGTQKHRSNPDAYVVTHVLETDYLGHGKELGAMITDDEILCRVNKSTARQRGYTISSNDTFVQFVAERAKKDILWGLLWAWHPLCWAGDTNVCDARLSGRRPGPVQYQLDAQYVDHRPRAAAPVTGRNVFIDLGAAGGDTVHAFYEAFPGSRSFETHAFEADAKFSSRIYSSMAWKYQAKVKYINAAAWLTDVTDLSLGVYDAASSLFRTSYNNLTGPPGTSNNHVERVRGIDFAKYLQDNFVERDLVIVKMDVELSEFPICWHLVKTGAIKLVDVLVVECHSQGRTGLDAAVTEQTCVMLVEVVSSYGVEVVIVSRPFVDLASRKALWSEWSKRFSL